jgi:hypothetical protein
MSPREWKAGERVRFVSPLPVTAEIGIPAGATGVIVDGRYIGPDGGYETLVLPDDGGNWMVRIRHPEMLAPALPALTPQALGPLADRAAALLAGSDAEAPEALLCELLDALGVEYEHREPS